MASTHTENNAVTAQTVRHKMIADTSRRVQMTVITWWWWCVLTPHPGEVHECAW